jgi:hypothetical protein
LLGASGILQEYFPMTVTELLESVRRVEVRTNRLVNDTMGGAYLSSFKGRGLDCARFKPIEFEEFNCGEFGSIKAGLPVSNLTLSRMAPTAKRSNMNSRGCNPRKAYDEMCDPCGVECVSLRTRGLTPTAIHVLSLQDNLGQCQNEPDKTGRALILIPSNSGGLEVGRDCS